MIFQIARVYEFVMNDRREHLKILVTRYFVVLENLLGNLINEDSDDAYRFITLILQIYWVSFYIELPEDQSTVACLEK